MTNPEDRLVLASEVVRWAVRAFIAGLLIGTVSGATAFYLGFSRGYREPVTLSATGGGYQCDIKATQGPGDCLIHDVTLRRTEPQLFPPTARAGDRFRLDDLGIDYVWVTDHGTMDHWCPVAPEDEDP